VPGNLAAPAVGSYPTVSPLPAPLPKRGRWRSVLCGTFQGSLPLGLPRAACPAESGPSSGVKAPAAPWPSPPPGPGVPTPRAHPKYTAHGLHPAQRPKTPGTKKPKDPKEADPGGQPKEDGLPRHHEAPSGRGLLQSGKEPAQEAHGGVPRARAVGLKLRALAKLLGPRRKARRWPCPHHHPPAPIRAPQKNQKGLVLPKAPGPKDLGRVARRVPKGVVPAREVHDVQALLGESLEESQNLSAIRGFQGLAIVVDGAGLKGQGIGLSPAYQRKSKNREQFSQVTTSRPSRSLSIVASESLRWHPLQACPSTYTTGSG